MKRSLFLNNVIVKKSKLHGYGVFAGKNIKKGELIEECYMIVSRKGGDKALDDYYFDINGKNGVFLGFGSIYNHSDDPNADYNFNEKKKIVIIKADRTILKGEEICISYGEDWFSSRGLKAKNKKTVNLKR